MNNKQILETYAMIKKTVNNRYNKAYGLAQELERLYSLSREDLIQELICIFITRNHQEIRNLRHYVRMFCYHELMNMKRKYNSAKCCSTNFIEHYNTVEEWNNFTLKR